MPTVEVPADLFDQSTGGLSASVAGEAIALSSKLTWDLLPTPGTLNKRNQRYNQYTTSFILLLVKPLDS